MSLNWRAPSGTPTGYQLQVCSGVCTATTLDSLWTNAATQPGPGDTTAAGLTCPAGSVTCTMRLRGVLVQGATTVYGPWAVRVLRPYAPTVVSADHGSVEDTIRVYFEQPADLGAGPSGDREYQFLVCSTSCGSAANWDLDAGATLAVDSVPSYPWVQNVTCAAETVCSVRMQLVDGAGRQSPLSPAFSATGAILPGAPTNVAAVTGSTSGTITVTWDAPNDAGLPAFDHYETSISTDGGTTWGAWTSTGGTATSIDLACAPGVTCTVRVRAVSEIGTGPSASDSAVGADVPGQLTGFSATLNSGDAVLAWTLGASYPALTDVEYQVSTDGGTTWGSTTSLSTTGTGATIAACSSTSDDTCDYRVRAVNAIGAGAWSSVDGFTIP